jgi:hypothetical protein
MARSLPYVPGLRANSLDSRRNGLADEIAIHRVVSGDVRIPLTCTEIAAAISKLDDGTRSARTIALTVGVTERTVTRHRKRRREKVAPMTGSD